MSTIANHRFNDTAGGKFCTECGVSWRTLVENRERWAQGEVGFVCNSDRGLYEYEAKELIGAYEEEQKSWSKVLGW